MEKIFYTDRSLVSSSAKKVKEILASYFAITNATIARTESGKPYLNGIDGLFFSVSHTDEKWFVAISNQNVGLDAEPLSRKPNLPLLLKRFSSAEREELQSEKDFLLHWTVKESAVKWLGETLAHTLSKLDYYKGGLFYQGLELPVSITNIELEGHILSVCCEKDFSSATIIKV